MKQVYAWSAVAGIVLASTSGNVFLARAMKQVGHVGKLWHQAGLLVVLGRILRNSNFLLGILSMTAAFYSLLLGLSWGDVSLVAPASASLTFVANAVAAKIFLHERMDRRRWLAALFVAAGVALLAA
jgi:drug/metabolite transporter (DMT)-like permease